MKDNSKKHSKVLILGSGPAGYTAAIYAARAMLKPILVHGAEPGGQMTTTTDVQNYPGYSDVIQGPWLMDQMKDQAKAVGTDMIQDHVIKVEMTDGTQFETRSTWGSEGEVLKLEIDPKSHSAWTGGKQKILDKGRVSKFNKKFQNFRTEKKN